MGGIDLGAAGPCVALSKIIEDVFADVRGFRLPINVDGVIGALVADLGLPPIGAKSLFVLGRTAGLAAHYFEEVRAQPPMRRVRFEEAVYRGPAARSLASPRRAAVSRPAKVRRDAAGCAPAP